MRLLHSKTLRVTPSNRLEGQRCIVLGASSAASLCRSVDSCVCCFSVPSALEHGPTDADSAPLKVVQEADRTR